MIVVLLGPPGSGKGTQSKILSEKFNIPQLSTGDILRKSVQNSTKVGLEAKAIMESGGLVSDEIMISIIKERVAESDCSKGFILDGFPRTLKQAKDLKVLFEKLDLEINCVLNFSIDDETVIDRISGRRVSEVGGHEYHIRYKKPKVDGICDITKSKLVQRSDDQPDKVLNRIKVFKESTFPLIEFYKNLSLLKDIDANQDINEVSKQVLDLV